MSSNTRNVFTMLIGLIVGFLVLRWALHVAVSILLSLLPLALVVGGIYAAYQVFGKKALGSGRRTLP